MPDEPVSTDTAVADSNRRTFTELMRGNYIIPIAIRDSMFRAGMERHSSSFELPRSRAWHTMRDRLNAEGVDMPHQQVDMSEDEAHQDNVNRIDMERLSTSPRDADMMAPACGCPSCCSDRLGRVMNRWPQPEGYDPMCRCGPCMRWRSHAANGMRQLTAGNQLPEPGEMPRSLVRDLDLLEITGTVTRAEPTGIMLDELYDELSRPSIVARRETTEERRARYRNMSSFEQNRDRRGHPLPNQPLAAGWKPNDWEG